MVKVGYIHLAKTALFSRDYFASIKITGLGRKTRKILLDDIDKEGYNESRPGNLII
jgi:hypothetical protein